MAIGSNLSCVRFGTWIDHFITEERQTWAINLTEEWGHVVPSNCNPVFYFHARFIYHAHVSFHWLHDPIILGSVILRKCDTQEGNWVARYVRQTPISWGSHRLSGERISLLFWKFSFYRAFYEMIFPKRKLFNSANSIGCERTRSSYAENFAQIVGLSYFSFKTKSRQLCEQQHILSPFPFHLQTFPRV